MSIVDIIVGILLLLGCFFAMTAGVGMLRMPDFYTRLHAAGITDTLGQALILGALLIMVIAGPPGGMAHPADTSGSSAAGTPQTAPHEAVAYDEHGEHNEHGEHTAASVAPDWQTAVKLVLIFVFLVITCPTSTHAITRAAHLARLHPWMNDEARRNEMRANADVLAATGTQTITPAVPPASAGDAPPTGGGA
ncbi:MAG: cation:proton antiporter [Planctomycetota bacterium]